MEIRLYPEKTTGAILQAIQAVMDENRRKQVFHAIVNPVTGEFAAAPEVDYFDVPGHDWRGVCGIRRSCWNTVPDYAERTANYLLAILQGDKNARL